MPRIGDDDQFESEYMAALRALVTPHGVPLSYDKDRAGIDTGLHLFVEGRSGREASHSRVWFQVKGKRASSLSADTFRTLHQLDVVVPVEHLQFWFGAPEPVYLVVYVEAVDLFLAEEVSDIVERQWPRGSFYAALAGLGKTVTVHISTSAVLNADRLNAMLAHRSMRIDGPAFRGRPLGHRFDPLRSQIDPCPPALFQRLIDRILSVHDFRPRETADLSSDLRLVRGRLYQTLEWQSPALSEYGYGPDDDFRDEPPVESIHGAALLVCDSQRERTRLSEAGRQTLRAALMGTPDDVKVAVIFNSPDLSGTGGLWRSTLRDARAAGWQGSAITIGLEAVTSLLLTATLIYFEFAPELRWHHVNYQ